MCSMKLWSLDLMKSHRYKPFRKHTNPFIQVSFIINVNVTFCATSTKLLQNSCLYCMGIKSVILIIIVLDIIVSDCKTGGMFETDAFEVAHISMKNCRPLKISLYSLKSTSRPSTLANSPQCLHLKLRVTRATALCIILFYKVQMLYMVLCNIISMRSHSKQ